MMYSGGLASAILITEEQPMWIDVAVTIVVLTHVMSPVTLFSRGDTSRQVIKQITGVGNCCKPADNSISFDTNTTDRHPSDCVWKRRGLVYLFIVI
jgi:hypothetical protein